MLAASTTYSNSLLFGLLQQLSYSSRIQSVLPNDRVVVNQLVNASQRTASRLGNEDILMASCLGDNEDGSVDAVAATYVFSLYFPMVEWL